MRKLTLSLLGAMAFVFTAATVAPVAMADEPLTFPRSNNTSTRLEADHNDEGADAWIAQFDKKTWAGIQVGGDDAYGYYTGTNPGFNGYALGQFYIDALPKYSVSGSLPAPAYTSPCPTFVDSNGHDVGGGCAANIDSRDPQTMATSTRQQPILDDMLAKMWDFRALNDRTTQTLDILFLLIPKGDLYPDAALGTTGKGFIDQTLDQDLAWYTGDIDSYVANAGSGVVNRLVSKMQIDAVTWASTNTTGTTVPGFTGGAGIGNSNTAFSAGTTDFLDQWVLSYTKEIGSPTPNSKVGIVSSYSGWYWKGAPVSCPLCDYTYPMGHDPVVKTVPEVNGHPNDDIPDP